MKFIPNVVTRKTAMAVLKVQKNSPNLLFGAGVAGIVGTVILSSRATLKLESLLEETNQKLADVRSLEHSSYSEQDRSRDKAILYIDAAVKVTKLYGPSIVLGTLSIASLVGSHRILTKRNAALTAAYKAVEKGFREYRDRVVEDLGEEKDREYLYGVEKTKEVVKGKKGEKEVDILTPSKTSPYGRFFNESNPNWQKTPEYNIMFLRGIQNYANDRLRAKGYLLLNDVYQDLGIERTTEGCVVGWLLDGNGDGYVDLGIFDGDNALRLYDYVTGREGEILLDFNVDGIIYEDI